MANAGAILYCPPGADRVTAVERLVSKPRQQNATQHQFAASELLAAVGGRRDRAAFADLFAFYAPRLGAYFRRLGTDAGQAEELVQEVMLAIWRRAERYDRDLGSANTWIFTIARNKRFDAFRRERRPEFDPDDPLLIEDGEPSPHQAVEAAETGRLLKQAVDDLPEDQKALLRMWYYDDKSHGAIAEAQNLPLGTVKARLRRALSQLRLTLPDPR